jgi:hypothetical protein
LPIAANAGSSALPFEVRRFGLSSYPSSSYERRQELAVDALFKRTGELKDAGFGGVLYRTLVDNPSFDTSNYHGIVNRYWGLLRADGTEKPACARFVQGVRAENGGRTSFAVTTGGTK